MHNDHTEHSQGPDVADALGTEAPTRPTGDSPIPLRKAMTGSVTFSKPAMIAIGFVLAVLCTVGAYALVSQHSPPQVATIPTPAPAQPGQTADTPVTGLDSSANSKATMPPGALPPTPIPKTAAESTAQVGGMLDHAIQQTQSENFDTSKAHEQNFGHVDTGTPNTGVPSITGASFSNVQADTAKAMRQRTIEQAITSPIKVGGSSADGVPALQPQVQPPPNPPATSGAPSLPQSSNGDNVIFANSTSQRGEYLPEHVQQAQSPFEIWSGTAIRAILDTAIDADLPGPVFAHITQDVYDSKTGATLLIPKGSTLHGRYNSDVAVGESRTQVVWDVLRWPNGRWMNLDAMPSGDTTGQAGLPSDVNDHRGRIITATALTAFFAAVPQLAAPQQAIAGGLVSVTPGQILAQNAAMQASNTGQAYVQRTMQQPPTLTVPKGTQFTLLIDRSIPLNPYEGG